MGLEITLTDREREGERKIERMGKRIELKKMVYLGREW